MFELRYYERQEDGNYNIRKEYYETCREALIYGRRFMARHPELRDKGDYIEIYDLETGECMTSGKKNAEERLGRKENK